jgi:Trypsin-co-occurring domain 2
MLFQSTGDVSQWMNRKETLMPQDNPIGLTELIEQVKRELLTPDVGAGADIPLFSVDEVSLELQVTVHKDAHGGIKVYVVELGGGIARDDGHKVNVTLTPLLSKEERIRLYKTHNPSRWQWVERMSVDAAMKGDSEPLGNSYGD